MMIIIIIIIISPRLGNTRLLSSGDSLVSWGERSSLTLVGNPYRNGVSIKYWCGGTLDPTLSYYE